MQEIFKQRRQQLIEAQKGPCVICIFSGKAPMRSLDEDYIFSVDRNFYYLTGIDRQNMVLVLKKTFEDVVTETLYIEPFDPVLAKWVGGRMKEEEARSCSGIMDVRDLRQFHQDMNGFFDFNRGTGKIHLYLDLWKYQYEQADTQAHHFAHKVQRDYPYIAIDEIYGEMAKMRAIKSKEELEKMKKAQKATQIAIEAMMKHAYPGVSEMELEGAFDFALMKQGIREKAFPTIVAGGKRGTILHYRDNKEIVRDNELVLIDLGATVDHYCADISRTFPVNGRFTDRQKEIYNLVLEAQQIVIENTRAGMTYGDMNQMVVDHYQKNLHRLGLDKDGKTVRDYYYHSVSHGLGLDCHDLDTKREYTLRPGMVVTVEPGFYIEEEGIGVRIENDILITEDAPIDLSSSILRTVDEIEAFMKK